MHAYQRMAIRERLEAKSTQERSLENSCIGEKPCREFYIALQGALGFGRRICRAAHFAKPTVEGLIQAGNLTRLGADPPSPPITDMLVIWHSRQFEA